MAGKPGIISVGEDRYDWPRELWGSRDWQEEAKLQSLLEQRPSVVQANVLLPAGFRLVEERDERRARLVEERDERRARLADEALRRYGLK